LVDLPARWRLGEKWSKNFVRDQYVSPSALIRG
jgi:hypothetical protein